MMKRVLSFMLVLSMIAALLAGCGGNKLEVHLQLLPLPKQQPPLPPKLPLPLT